MNATCSNCGGTRIESGVAIGESAEVGNIGLKYNSGKMTLGIIINICAGLIIPWIFGIILYFKDKKVLFLFGPFAGLKAYTLNEFGFHLNFWRYIPVYLKDDLTTVSANLGFFLILSCYLIYYLRKK
jgi:hypothetical protein